MTTQNLTDKEYYFLSNYRDLPKPLQKLALAIVLALVDGDSAKRGLAMAEQELGKRG